MSIRRAEAGDYAAVRSLAEALAAHIEEPPPPLTLERYLAFYVHEHAPVHLFVALLEDRVAGLIAWILTHELYSAQAGMYISDIVVHAEARRKGVGRALMTKAKEWAADHGVTKLGWDVWKHNASAMQFYARLGATVDTEALPHLLLLTNR
ncbi:MULTISPECIES: GNAT family N-acetyltransferase [unclassified Bradyrhizobium]|uniref:GNAT family N-acetyltransferase n=1 Tax=unclassified Bradyrhizobium TaxID=2631580 RepID=UPI0015A71C63|nr:MULTISPECIES: GNAT family N-acetyltransferase [unclassified Bradyrhizobium]MBB4379741.1 GNAT superfamily N-acetyltransferase [Bradyrhizobium sp. SBR1B]